MKKTGEILKAAREEKNLSIHEVGISLKISNKVIKAMEDGDTKNLPQAAFLRGFVKSYAQYLKLNLETVMASFSEEMGSGPLKEMATTEAAPALNNPSSEGLAKALNSSLDSKMESKPEIAKAFRANTDDKKSSEKSPIAAINDPNKKNIWPLLITIVVLIGAITVVKKVIDRYSKEAITDTAGLEGEQEKPLNNIAVTGTGSEQPAASSTGPSTSPAKADSAETATVTTTSGVSIPTGINEAIAAVTGVSSTAKNEDKKEATKNESSAETEKPKEVPVKNLELIVEALDSLDIEYSAGGGKTQSLHLEPLQVHTFKSKAGLKLSLSNAGAANLTLNGKDLGVPGDLGKPKKLSY